MLGKKTIVASLAAGVLALGAAFASADTIDVTNFNGGADNFVSGGVAHYFYDVTLDGSADVESGDGFVIFDFGGFNGTAILSSFSPTVAGLGTFSLTDQASFGTTLPGYSPVDDSGATFPTKVGSTNANDNPNIPNLTFTYSGSTYVAANNVSTSAELEIDSTDLAGPVQVAAVGVDHSGAGTSASGSENTVDAPAPLVGVPLPSSLLAGSVLLGIVAVRRQVATRCQD